MQFGKAATVAAFILLCLLAGAIGAIFTTPAIPTWYASLNKPDFNPPNWVFGPVWTTLYILMGVAAYLVYREGKNAERALNVFAGQLALNTMWSFLFFGLQSPFLGLVCIITLWLAIAATIREFYAHSRTAAMLMVPYILWVSFATVLNFFVWVLN